MALRKATKKVVAKAAPVNKDTAVLDELIGELNRLGGRYATVAAEAQKKR